MKKILASLLVVMLIIPASITAFGATKKDVDTVISSAVDYALPYDGYSKTESYTTDTSKYFLMHVKSGEASEELKDSYLDSLTSALEAGTLSGLGNISMVLEIMALLDIDAENYNGYNLIDMFLSTAVDDIAYSPYNYTYAIEAAAMYSLDDFAAALCDELVNTYYTIGTGTDFWGGWGTSADDLAFFLLALSYYQDSYSVYIEDAETLLETYLADGGYGYGYGDANTDSTATALAAYSALGDKEKADSIYDLLLAFYDESTGAFSSDYDPYYATADALFGLEYYTDLLSDEETDTDETADEDVTDINSSTDKDKNTEDEGEDADSEEAAEDISEDAAVDTGDNENTADDETAVSNVNTEESGKVNDSENPESTNEDTGTVSPATGNDSIALVVFIALTAVIFAAVLLFKHKEKKI